MENKTKKSDVPKYHIPTRGIEDALNERRYTVGDIGVSYRTINHWAETGILPEGVAKSGEWKKFSDLEVAWIKIIKCLRNYGLSLKKISGIRSQILKWDKKTDTYPVFENYVARTFVSDSDPYIVVFEDGAATLASMQEIEDPEKFPEIRNKLLVSLRDIMRERVGLSVAPNRLMLVSDEGKQLLKALWDNDGEFKVASKDGFIVSIKKMEILKSYATNPPLEQINKDLRKEKGFAEVAVQYGDGEAQSAKIVRWEKLLKRRF